MTEYKRENIQPSARKPLHNSCKNCCLTCLLPLRESMGRYGIDTHKSRKSERNTAQAKSIDESIDEPDNIQSEPRHIPEGGLTKYPTNNRKQTMDTSKDSDNEDESDNTNTTETYLKAYANSIKKQLIFKPDILNTVAEDRAGQYIIYTVIFIIVACVACLIKPIIHLNENKVHSDIIYDKSKFFNDMTQLGQKYRVTDNSILQIKSGIATIFQRQDTGSFIFTYNSRSSNFDPILFDNFMNELTSSSSRFLRNSEDIRDPVIIDSPMLDMQIHSELIEKYRDDVSKTGVMLVKDLDKVPSSLAMAFHYYCDEFNPLIKKSAIFFTLNMAKCPDPNTSHTSIEKCLAKKWSMVAPDNITPLLTRVVGIIVNIFP